MPTPKIALRKLSQLTPDPQNARTHSEAQIMQIVDSINRWGWTAPMLVDDVIRAGNGRFAAAQRIYAAGGTIFMAPGEAHGGIPLPADTVPIIDCTGWTEEERKAYALADNALAEQAGWDEQILISQLTELQAADFDVALVGFSSDFIDALMLPVEAATPVEKAPEPPANPVSKQGDTWLLGSHRIRCGSSTVAADVEALLAGEVPHLMVTDPPYGVEYDPSWRADTKRADGKSLSTGNVAMGKVLNDDQADWTEAWALFPGEVAYVWHGALHSAEVQRSLETCGFEMRAAIIWAKPRAPISRAHYHWRHEPCLYMVRKGGTGHWNGDRKQNTVWEIANNDGANAEREEATSHGTQKPVECMERPIRNNSKRGDGIYEPFSGSGTTIIAAERTGRRCFAMELSEAYVDVAVIRWQRQTGKAATLEADGRTFAAVSAERVPELA